MEPVVIDTDVFSFIAKGDTRAARYQSELVGKQLCLSFQTIAELRLWCLVRNWGMGRRQALDALLTRYVVLPFDAPMAQHWADVTAHRRKLGEPIDCGDAWIAANALRHDALLFSHKAGDYRDIPGLRVVSHHR
jgi:predicted nucleic acid-binding protein